MPRRRAARKSKTWYQVYAVDVFPGKWIGETPAADPELVIGRNVEVVARDITGDFMHEKYKLWFKIFRVDGSKAYARFVKEMLNRDYLRSIVQRRTSRVDVMAEGETKDGHLVRIFYIIITSVRIRCGQEKAVRSKVVEYLSEQIPRLTLEELVRSSIFNEPVNFSESIRQISTKIAPIKNIEPRKTVVLRFGEATPSLERKEAEAETETEEVLVEEISHNYNESSEHQ